jgi:hypothetical protein
MLHSNGYSLVHGLLYKNRAVKYIVMKEESLHNFSAMVRLIAKHSFIPDKAERIKNEVINITISEILNFSYSCFNYLAGELNPRGATLCLDP